MQHFPLRRMGVTWCATRQNIRFKASFKYAFSVILASSIFLQSQLNVLIATFPEHDDHLDTDRSILLKQPAFRQMQPWIRCNLSLQRNDMNTSRYDLARFVSWDWIPPALRRIFLAALFTTTERDRLSPSLLMSMITAVTHCRELVLTSLNRNDEPNIEVDILHSLTAGAIRNQSLTSPWTAGQLG